MGRPLLHRYRHPARAGPAPAPYAIAAVPRPGIEAKGGLDSGLARGIAGLRPSVIIRFGCGCDRLRRHGSGAFRYAACGKRRARQQHLPNALQVRTGVARAVCHARNYGWKRGASPAARRERIVSGILAADCWRAVSASTAFGMRFRNGRCPTKMHPARAALSRHASL